VLNSRPAFFFAGEGPEVPTVSPCTAEIQQTFHPPDKAEFFARFDAMNGKNEADVLAEATLRRRRAAPAPSADGVNGGPPPPEPPSDGRGGDGKFSKGNKFGRGNPHYTRLAQNRTVFLEYFGPEHLKEIARELMLRALKGDLEAIKIILGYVIGRPLPAVDADRVDLDEWDLRDATETRKLIDAMKTAKTAASSEN
jgi:hypothetical protein